MKEFVVTLTIKSDHDEATVDTIKETVEQMLAIAKNDAAETMEDDGFDSGLCCELADDMSIEVAAPVDYDAVMSFLDEVRQLLWMLGHIKMANHAAQLCGKLAPEEHENKGR